MDTTLVVAIIIAAVAVIVIAGLFWYVQSNQNRTKHLRGTFGSEYDRAVTEAGGRRRAEQELAAREKRVERLDIRPLADSQRQEFADHWRSVQARFVDDPGGAVGDADALVNEVMTARGYPMGEWEQRAADISVDHPQVVANYRSAYRLTHSDDGRGDTESLRQAMVHYRALFDELLMPEPAGTRR